jgi:CO/xanthine dehydrogenase FAD-binding subunit
MWYSLKTILTPPSWEVAWKARSDPHTTFFAGGSYLVAKRNPQVETLVDLNQLLDRTVDASYEKVYVGAGATLQDFVEVVQQVQPKCRLIKAAKDSCPSKNIRQQRTFGGEVARGRPDSEVLVFLHAVDADLTVVTDHERTVSIREWDGEGIIKDITYYPRYLGGVELARYAVIPSAPAMLIVGGIRRESRFEFAVGGNVDKINVYFSPADQWDGQRAAMLAEEACRQFSSDHLGSKDYKRALLTVALQRVGAAL